MRNIILLLALAATLIVLTNLSALMADWHYVVTGEPGEVLYATGFDDRLDDWERYDGRLSAQMADSALRIDVGASQSLPFSTSRFYFGDFDLTVRARPLAGPLDNGYGVIFRAQDSRNYYVFLISSDGYYQVRRALDGQPKVLSDWIPSTLIVQGLDADNELRVVAQGETFQFFVNGQALELCIPDDPDAVSTYADQCIQGQMLPELVDDAIDRGQIGVIAQALDEPGVAVEFDNVRVFSPEASGG
ncbi:MAG: hypothetical protein K8J31_19265 [Anaerolineae bacterium]|nr:hypothetical protein [Anaerolineae bacterium]